MAGNDSSKGTQPYRAALSNEEELRLMLSVRQSLQIWPSSYKTGKVEINPVNGLPLYKPTPADISINSRKDGDSDTILSQNVNIFDSTGCEPYTGDELIQDQRFAT